jgi:hypothetical protein
MRITRMVLAVAACATGTIGAGAVAAQDTADCAYSACALRVQQGIFGRSLVRGLEEKKVAGLGMFVGGLDEAFAGSPIAQEHAVAYRRRHNAGSVLSLLGGAAFFVALFAADGSGGFYGDGWAVGLLAGSLLGLTGALVSVSGEDHLHRAIWEYNRQTGR